MNKEDYVQLHTILAKFKCELITTANKTRDLETSKEMFETKRWIDRLLSDRIFLKIEGDRNE